MNGHGALRGELLEHEPMARHTSWRAGGPARWFYKPADLPDLVDFLRGLPAEEPVVWLGLGSNMLVRDGGIEGTVIATRFGLTGLAPTGERTVRAEAGVACAKVARFCADRALTGAEFLAGIPGAMGGALAMNAGAFGGETWHWVCAVETVDRQGQRRTRPASDFRIGYRQVDGPPGEWFVAAHLALEPGRASQARDRIRGLLAQRGATQPMGTASCGSVFRNPTGDYAGRLVEAAGLKGTCVGAACVSEVHANFIVNRGGARAGDIEALIQQVSEAVMRAFGIRLEPEVRIVGRAGEERA